MKVDNQTYVVQGEWTVLITIDEPRPAAELANFIQQLRVEISRQTMMARWMPHWQSRLDAVEDQCQNPRRWWLRGRTRQRRGVIDGVGDALHYLFGTATDDVVADIHQAVEKLAQNQGRLIHQFSDFTTIVNHTYDEIQANRDQLDLLSIALYNLSAVVDDRVRSLMERVYQQEARANIEEVLYQLERLGDRYVQAHEAWLHRKENLEAGRLTENILPPLVLQDILDSAAGHASQPVTPLQCMVLWTFDSCPYLDWELLGIPNTAPRSHATSLASRGATCMACPCGWVAGHPDASEISTAQYWDRRPGHVARLLWSTPARVPTWTDHPRRQLPLSDTTLGQLS